MKTESILKTDVLDIIFQNKNKEYGAYQLRKYYPSRLKKSIGITFLLVLVFAALQSWKTPRKVCGIELGLVEDYVLTKYEAPEEKAKPVEKKKLMKQQMAQAPLTNPLIVPNDKVSNAIVENAAIDTMHIGVKPIDGTASTGIVGIEPIDSKEKSGGGATAINKITDTDDENPIFNPSNMPEFPGGIDAMHNFMLRNLHQPDDIEEGQKIVIIVKFVVDKTGAISDIEILQNGREDLDNEVIRVVNKMPKWKPGLQNGLPVSVFYKMPVTFINGY